MAAAKIIADDYPVTVKFYVDDVKRYTRVVDSEFAFRLPGGFRGEQFEIVNDGVICHRIEGIRCYLEI
jgi:hypothetical protein